MTSQAPAVLMKIRERQFRYFPYLMAVMAGVLVLSNILSAAKVIVLFGYTFSASVMLYPLVFLSGDISTEVYGYERTRKIIWIGFVCLTVCTILFSVVGALPSPPNWDGQPAYDKIFGAVPQIVIASFISYLVGEFVNSFIVSRLKVWMVKRQLSGWIGAILSSVAESFVCRIGATIAEKARCGWLNRSLAVFSQNVDMALRFVTSTFVAQFFDSIIFFPGAFWGRLEQSQILEMTLNSWLGKSLWESLLVVFTVNLVVWIKHAEHYDALDEGVNYSPLAGGPSHARSLE